jgi:hypothetical protein
VPHRYVRDMHGYGDAPPFADWPGNAHIAVQFVLNYEEGGENCILHGDRASEAFLSRSSARSPGRPAPHEHGIDLRIRRPRRLLAAASPVHARDMPVTVFGVATALKRSPEAGRGHEGGGLGDREPWAEMDRLPDFTRGRERAHIAEAIRIHEEVTGRAPARLLQGRTSSTRCSSPWRRAASSTAPIPMPTTCPTGSRVRTARSSSSCPTRSTPTTCASPRRAGLQFRRPVLRLSQGQLRHALRRGRGRAEDDVGRPALPPRRPPGRAAALARFLELRREPRAGLGRDAARHRPPLGARHPRPKRTSGAACSPRIPTLRASSPQARRLTPRFGGAGLGRARRADRRRAGRVHRLNEAYTGTFGFPFIIAVRGPHEGGDPRRLPARDRSGNAGRRVRHRLPRGRAHRTAAAEGDMLP